MADGLLGKAAPAAFTEVDLYTVPASKVATADINISNRGEDVALVRLAFGTGGAGSVATSDYVAYDLPVAAGEVIQFVATPLGAGEVVTAFSDSALVSYRVSGFEEVA